MVYTVYLLFSDACLKHYTGMTTNPEERLRSHNIYGKDWTKKCRPWRLIYTKSFEDKAEAQRYEKWLKSGQGRAFVKDLPH
jgi:putative endonuclease